MSSLLSLPIVHPEQPFLLPEDNQIRGQFLFRADFPPTQTILRFCPFSASR
ncbi:hypothetical protein [Vibrio ostreicida]|uniref:hypothetical protein n=1 Tax=Vibrio ostreicida TaxID=526588 RepID=UPI0015C344DF|nr:hypothetical protein [Vibrio ostreicida]